MKYINDDKARRTQLFVSVWWKRFKLSQRLHSLDDRMLADIGINRGEIGAIVKKSIPSAGIVERLVAVANKLNEIRKNHEAARELAGLDDRMLADMGLYRSDITSISRGYYPERRSSASPLTSYGVEEAVLQGAANDDHRHAA